MTVADLCERMDVVEFRHWQAFYMMRDEEIRRAESDARAEAMAARGRAAAAR